MSRQWKRQNLTTEKAMAVLADIQKLHGKLPVKLVRDILKKDECIDLPSREQQELTTTRDLIRIFRDRCVKSGDVQLELVSFEETTTLADGTIVTQDYYKRFCEHTKDEAVQNLSSQRKKCKSGIDKFYRHFDGYTVRFGEEFQTGLPFDLPRRMEDE